MAWNPSPQVASLRDYSAKFNSEQVVLVAINEDGTFEVISYGKTKALCAKAEQLNNHLFDAVMDYYTKGGADHE